MKKFKLRKITRRGRPFFQGSQFAINSPFGGYLLRKSNAKEKRPISKKYPMHLVLNSDLLKKNHRLRLGLLDRQTQDLIFSLARKLEIKILRFKNFGFEVQMVVKVPGRRELSCFFRTITGLIARRILSAERGAPSRFELWKVRPFSRILVGWAKQEYSEFLMCFGFSYDSLKDYLSSA